jgi:putative hemolysin
MSLLESADPAIQNDPEALSGGAPETGPRAEGAGAAEHSWLERALDDMLALRRQDPSRWVAQARRLLGLTEVDDVLSRIETGERPDMMAAVAEAMDIRFVFNGLENLAGIGDRPVIVYGNHPIGSGNVLGMSLLLTQRFSDHRMIGHRYMKFIRAFAEKMIPVDPFRSTSAINLESLVKLRREFGTQYQALGLFPAGNSSQLKWSGTISDRRWSDAFVRIARHHDALMVPLWFSGRNRLRYYVASKIRAELGFLALPAEFLRLRGKSITVNIGKPISPDLLRAMPSRPAQLGFLRAGVYELERERATPAAAANDLLPSGASAAPLPDEAGGSRPKAIGAAGRAQPRVVDSVPVGEHLELRFFDAAAAARIEELGGSAGRDGLDGATTRVVLTPRDRLVPLAHWHVLDWGQFAPAELDRLSPLRRAFRLPDAVAHKGSNWLEIVGFAVGSRYEGSATLRQIRMGLRRSAALSIEATDLVGLVAPQETSFVLAALQFAMLQKARGDAPLLRAGAAHELLGATQHHDWRPHRDVVGGEGRPARRRIGPTDPVLRAVSGLGLRFGAAGLSAESAPRPCILGRLSLAY